MQAAAKRYMARLTSSQAYRYLPICLLFLLLEIILPFRQRFRRSASDPQHPAEGASHRRVARQRRCAPAARAGRSTARRCCGKTCAGASLARRRCCETHRQMRNGHTFVRAVVSRLFASSCSHYNAHLCSVQSSRSNKEAPCPHCVLFNSIPTLLTIAIV